MIGGFIYGWFIAHVSVIGVWIVSLVGLCVSGASLGRLVLGRDAVLEVSRA